MGRVSTGRAVPRGVVVKTANTTTGSGEAWLSTADICHRYGISEQAWRKAWQSWPTLTAAARRFRTSPESAGKRRWPAAVIAQWWEESSR